MPSTQSTRRVGVMLPRDLPTAQVMPFIQRAEALGFDELWVVEDLGFRGGIAQAAIALATTSRMTIGIGILPAAVRNVAFMAMEITTLAQLYPGRVTVGIGHGMPDWLRAVGAWPAKPLTFLREYTVALTALVRGEAGPAAGTYVDVSGVRLDEVAEVAPPIVWGVRGPKSLAAAGEVADGIVLAEPATPRYIDHATRLLGRGDHAAPLVVTYDVAAVAEEDTVAYEAVRPLLAMLRDPDWAPHLAGLPYADDVHALARATGSGEEFASRLRAEWISDLTLAGTPESVRAKIAARHDAGATTVIMTPLGDDRLSSLDTLATTLTA